MVLQKHWKYPHFNLVICPNFYTIHGVLKARILKWFAIPSPVDHILSDLSTRTRPTWVAPQAWLSFIELDKAVVLVWLDRLVFCDYGFSVSALLQHLLFYLVFSYLGRGVSLHSCSSKAQPLLLILEEGYLLTADPPDLERGIAPLGPPVPAEPPLLGRRVAPPGRHP